MAERDVGVELYQQAEARLAAGEMTLAARLCDRSRAVLLEADDLDGACAAAALEAHVHLRIGQLAEARECILWIEHEAEAHGLTERHLAALTDKGALLEMAGDFEGALQVHKQALELQRRSGETLGVATAAGNVGRLLTRLLQPDEARVLLEESLRLFDDAGNEPGVINALICIGDLERAGGHLGAAEVAFAEAVERSGDEHLALLRAVALLNQGHILRDRGQVVAAQEAFDASGKIAQEFGDMRGVARARLAQALALADSAVPERSLEAFAEAEKAFVDIGQPAGAIAATVNRAAVLCRVGRMNEGRAGLLAAGEALSLAGDLRAAVEVGLALAEVHLIMGDAAAAEAALEEIDPTPGGARLVLRRALLSARLSMRSGLLGDARRLTDDAAIADASEAERFAGRLQDSELAVLADDPRAPSLLAELLAVVDPELHPREYAAARTANAQYEFWRGDLDLAEASYREAQARWQAMGEALPTLQARGALWRLEALAGRLPAAGPVFEASSVLEEQPARDAAASMRALGLSLTVAADKSLDRETEVAAADAIAGEVFVLLSSGNRLAAASELAFAATVTGISRLREEATKLFAATEVVPPRWFIDD